MALIRMVTSKVYNLERNMNRSTNRMMDSYFQLSYSTNRLSNVWYSDTSEKFSSIVKENLKGLSISLDRLDALRMELAQEIGQWESTDASFNSSAINAWAGGGIGGGGGSSWGYEKPRNKSDEYLDFIIRYILEPFEFSTDKKNPLLGSVFGSTALNKIFGITGAALGLTTIIHRNWTDPNYSTTGMRVAAVTVDVSYEVARKLIITGIATKLTATTMAAALVAGIAQKATVIGIPTGVATIVAGVGVSVAIWIGTDTTVTTVTDAAFINTGLRNTIIEKLGGFIDSKINT